MASGEKATKFNAIVAMDRNRAIGFKGALPWYYAEDLAFFKRNTTNKIIVMGRKTFDSIGRVLPGRKSVVLTRDQGWVVDCTDINYEHVHIVHSLDALRALLINKLDAEEVFVIGGAEIFRALLPRIHRVIVTHIDQIATDADVFMPEFESRVRSERIVESHDSLTMMEYTLDEPIGHCYTERSDVE